ncbi:hypothetical protein [Clostridium drakei]|nr:hypothetical protein [Clostridium drakei]
MIREIESMIYEIERLKSGNNSISLEEAVEKAEESLRNLKKELERYN